jgi:predicted transcriptional regulator of viral defense system
MSTVKLTKQYEKRLIDYCRYEKIAFITKDELINVLKALGITTKIPNLLRAGTISTIMRNSVYHVIGINGSIQQLLRKIFYIEEPYFLYGIYVYNSYGFINQLPAWYQVANTRIKRNKILAGYNIQFKTPMDGYFFGIDSQTAMLDKERSLIDFCRSYGYSRYIDVLEKEADQFEINKLIDYALKYPLNNIARRVLYGVNTITTLKPEVIDSVRTGSIIKLTDNPSRKGKIDRNFDIIINT